MSTFTNNNVASGDLVRASDHNTQGANIASVVNGNIEADNLAANAVTTAKIADRNVTPAKISFTTTAFTPTYGGTGSLTFTTVTTDYARFADFGDYVYIELSAIGTTGGTTNVGITVAGLPFNANVSGNGFYPLAAMVTDSVTFIGSAYFSAAGTIQIRKGDAGNWGLGASRRVSFSGFYRKA